MRVLAGEEIDALLDLERLLDAVEDGLIAQWRGTVERPDRPHLPIGTDTPSNPAGTALVMPAYVHGAEYFVTKLASVHPINADRNLPTVQAIVIAIEADTGVPAAILEGTIVTNARTGCIGGVAVRTLRDGPLSVGVLGAGAQARWQTRAIAAAVECSTIRVYSPSSSRERCASDLHEEGYPATAVSSAREAVADAAVVVTATTSHEPVFPAGALSANALVVAIGAYTAEMQELEPAVIDTAAAVYADVPAEVATIGDIRASAIDSDALRSLGGLLAGDVAAPSDGHIVVESVGTAVLDGVATELILDEAIAANQGVEIDL